MAVGPCECIIPSDHPDDAFGSRQAGTYNCSARERQLPGECGVSWLHLSKAEQGGSRMQMATDEGGLSAISQSKFHQVKPVLVRQQEMGDSLEFSLGVGPNPIVAKPQYRTHPIFRGLDQ